ncbi:MAG: SAM-dependent methyltransferase, partial [Gammaproteobacteria bacterium]
VFSIIASVTNSGSILVTYSSKGSVRKSLTTCGFKVTKVPGPPGKFEMVRAVRI